MADQLEHPHGTISDELDGSWSHIKPENAEDARILVLRSFIDNLVDTVATA